MRMPLKLCHAVPVTWMLLLTVTLIGGFTLNAAPPRYDHIVIVVEENRALTQIIGDRVNAPYINSLADGGVSMGSMFVIVHPSQPNYIHLFSGDNQGVIDDDLPPNFSTNATSTYPVTIINGTWERVRFRAVGVGAPRRFARVEVSLLQ